jgi:hypothetical protein
MAALSGPREDNRQGGPHEAIFDRTGSCGHFGNGCRGRADTGSRSLGLGRLGLGVRRTWRHRIVSQLYPRNRTLIGGPINVC